MMSLTETSQRRSLADAVPAPPWASQTLTKYTRTGRGRGTVRRLFPKRWKVLKVMKK